METLGRAVVEKQRQKERNDEKRLELSDITHRMVSNGLKFSPPSYSSRAVGSWVVGHAPAALLLVAN